MRVLVILLVVGILLFVGVMVWGSSNHSSKAEPTPDTFNSDQYPLLGSFNTVLGSFGPKLKSTELQPARGVFDLQTQPGYSVRVLPDNDHKFRQAKFLVQPSAACAEVKFTALDSKLPPKVKNPQDSNDRKDKRPNEFTLTVFAAGGTLTVERAPGPAGVCKVTLE